MMFGFCLFASGFGNSVSVCVCFFLLALSVRETDASYQFIFFNGNNKCALKKGRRIHTGR